MPKTVNSYSPDGALNSTMGREGLDIGPAPDFWADLEKIRTKLKPTATKPALQASALASQPGAQFGGVQKPREEYDYDPTFAVQKFPGGTGGTYNSPYDPAQSYAGGQNPMATGYRRTRRS